PDAGSFTRRTATVTISAPEASCARAMTAGEEYFPVPTIRRDENAFPAMTRWSMGSLLRRAAADGIGDFHVIPVPDLNRVERRALQYREIMLHGHAPAVELESGKERRDGHGSRKLERVAVKRDLQVTRPDAWSAHLAEREAERADGQICGQSKR